MERCKCAVLFLLKSQTNLLVGHLAALLAPKSEAFRNVSWQCNREGGPLGSHAAFPLAFKTSMNQMLFKFLRVEHLMSFYINLIRKRLGCGKR